jgi:uncharacterized protein
MDYSLSGRLSAEEIRIEQANFISKVYGWMSSALFITAMVAMWVASTPAIANVIIGNKILFYVMIGAEFGLVWYMASRIMQMSLSKAIFLFILYAALNGLTLSVIFLVYTMGSIASTFLITAGTFGIMSAYGYYTKTDLTSMGKLAMMGLIGIIIASVVNIFFQNELLYWVSTYVGILVFVGLTAYDTQKIKEQNILGNEGTEEDSKEAIRGAITLYLDFINMFLLLLRLFGSRK